MYLLYVRPFLIDKETHSYIDKPKIPADENIAKPAFEKIKQFSLCVFEKVARAGEKFDKQIKFSG